MTTIDEKCLDIFPGWLGSLGDDILTLLGAAEVRDGPAGARKVLVGSINYVFKSLDLIPDGIDDIGYLDDAFVMRVGASIASREDLSTLGGEASAGIERLAADAGLIGDFLGERLYKRFEAYVGRLARGAARGRSVEDICGGDDEVFRAFAADVRSFSKGYRVPSFTKDRRSLIKLKAFFEAKLPE